MVNDSAHQYADYLPEPLYPGFIDPEAPTSAPEPGTGTVWVIPPEEDLLNEPRRWEGVWRAAEKHTGIWAQSRDEAVIWALSTPATRWLTREHMGEPWVDLTVAVPPDPGTGTVWVHSPESQGWWGAVWKAGGGAELASLRGSHEDVVAWALAQPAVRWLGLTLQADVNSHWADLKAGMQPPEPDDR